MTRELGKRYDPQAIEPRIYQRWLEAGIFHAAEDSPAEPYAVVIPPPNVTGVLHLGHALNNTLQDLLIRYRRMLGDNAMWLPGTDHAGIATQNVVERELLKEGLSREQLGREAFLERVWRWKEDNGSRIIEQLKRLGCSCDWARERFTMDEGLSRAVTEVFCRLYEAGLIYRGEYLVNWCPRCGTALSDEEAIPKETQGHLYRIRYPLEGAEGQYLVVATTRPETMLGDTAVAVHPEDERYRELVGRTVVLPLLGRRIPVVADPYVDRAFGTGCLKITPAHDPHDFEVAERHGLPRINVMTPSAKINEEGGPYRGLDRFEARKRVLADLEAAGLLEGKQPHTHNVPRCQRCATVLEYRLSEQWFVRMKPLAQPAIEVVRQGRIRFHPERWTGVYLHWMENIRDWCISRQLWWGHRIPVWYCGTCKGQTVSRQPPSACAHCGATEGLEQDPDVLDTWFSSWLWPFSTLGWPEDTPALRTFYPTRTLVTGHEIIFFWVARMVMAGLFCMREIPFSDVVIHGIIRDERGRKMSKSLGNGVDPLEVIEETSADALRFTLVYLTPEGQDARISKQKFELGRNFCTKLWNAARLVLSNLEGYRWRPGLPEQLEPEDRWIVSRLHAATAGARAALDAFRFHAYLQSLYDFVWGEFCDWWLEIVKPRWYEGGPEVRERAQQVAVYVLERVLRLLHPVVPFVTEEIWGRLREAVQAESWQPLLATAPFPEAEPERIDPELEERFALLTTLVRELRNIRAEHQIPPGRAIAAMVTTARAPAGAESTAPSASLRLVEQGRALLQRLARLERLEIAPGLERPRGAATAAVKDLEVHVPLEGVIDLEAERRRLESRQNKLAAQLGAARNKLSQPSFVERAPAEVVERTRALVRDLEQELRALEASLAEMGQPQQRS